MTHKKTKNKRSFKNFEEKVKFVVKEENKLYKQHKIAKSFTINFPFRNKIPFSVKVASWILRRKGGIIDTKYFDLKLKK